MQLIERRRTVLLTLFLLALLGTPSQAYVDPGTSSALFQAGYLILTSIVAGLTFFLRPLKAFYYRITGKKPKAAAPPAP